MNTSKQSEAKKEKKLNPGQLPVDENQQQEQPGENPTDLTPEEIAEMENGLPAVQEETPADMQAIFNTLEGAENLRELTAEYLDLNTFTEGETRPFIFTGKTSFTTDKKDTEGNFIVKPAVTLLSKEGKSLICASTVIVNSLFKVEQTPAGIKIQVNGKKKGKEGSYFDCKVYVM